MTAETAGSADRTMREALLSKLSTLRDRFARHKEQHRVSDRGCA